MPCEVIVPFVAPRVIEAYQLSVFRIEPGDVRSFVAIAMEAREGQVLENRQSAVLLSDDMVDLERQGIKGRRHQAVLA